MSRKDIFVKVEWLQVPTEAVDQRAPQLAHLLSQGIGKRVSDGDALLLLVRLWQWVLAKVNPDAGDLVAEFERCATLPDVRAAETIATACRWPVSKADVLIQALLDSEVRALASDGVNVRVQGLSERYTTLAEKQRDNRGRAAASKLAKSRGWKSLKEGGYANATTGEVVESWRELLTLLGGGK